MPAGPLGTCWAPGAWADTCWEAGTWGDSDGAVPVPDVVVRVRGSHAVTPDAEFAVVDSGLIVKDPSDSIWLCFDWDAEHLAEGVTIEESAFTIEALEHDDGSPAAALTSASEDIVSDDRKTQALIAVGTLGALYRINNEIHSSDGQIKERSILVRVEER